MSICLVLCTAPLWLASLPLRAAPSAQQAGDGREQPFDGRTLDRWEGDLDFWSVEDGAIVGRTTAERTLEQSTYLVWLGSPLRDFELELDYKVEGGNSGIGFRLRGQWPGELVGLQADLESGSDWTGALFEQGGRGALALRGEHATWFDGGAAERLEFAPPEELQQRIKTGDWNHYLIRAVGNRVDLVINGWPMSSFVDRDSSRAASEGSLALQLHEGAPMEVRFRNLKLRRLDAGEPLQWAVAPRWIWTTADASEPSRAWFGRAFVLDQPATWVHLECAADDACEVEIDGRPVLATEDWRRPVWLELVGGLGPGFHWIDVRARSEEARAGFHFALDLALEDGSRRRIVSDAAWQASSREPAANWLLSPGMEARPGNAVEVARVGALPWGQLPQAVPYVHALPLGAERLITPDGFQAELLYAAPRALEGSWISMAFDPKGRIYVSDQSGSLYRVQLAPAPDGGVTSVEPVDVPVGEAHGLLWAFDSLYAVVTRARRYESGLYRLRDSDGDDRLDQVERLATFDGENAGEHGPHAVLLAPDGQSLIVVAGNHTRLPQPLLASRVPMVWADDQLLALEEDPGGHAVGIEAPGGWIARTNADATGWELLAAGLRNSYDAAFNREGELFTFDSDMEWDRGLPWYRPPRLVHVVSGADYGWRRGSGKWPAWVPDSLPPAGETGAASPTGMAFGGASNFPEPYRSCLFAGDWTQGRILTFALEPALASYTATATNFLSGRPLPVTDMAFGPDGALYFVTGGRRTHSGLYRVRWAGPPPEAAVPPAAETPDFFARGLRRNIEQLHQPVAEAPYETLLPLLASPDRFLRHAARVALEHQPPESWRGLAFAMESEPIAIQALVALARCDPSAERETLLAQLESLGVEAMPTELRRDWLRALSLVIIRRGLPEEETAARLSERLRGLLGRDGPESDRTLCELLVALRDPQMVPLALPAFEEELTPGRALAYAWPLRLARVGWSEPLRERYFRWLGRVREVWSGGYSFEGYLEAMVRDALRIVDESERARLEQLATPRPDEPIPDLPQGSQRDFTLRWTLEELSAAMAAPKRPPAYANGRAMFVRARCAQCHSIAGLGGNSGPDLSSVAGRFSTHEMLEAILHPSAVVSDQYRDTELLTTDERLLVGRVLEIDAERVRLRTAPPLEEELEVPRDQILEVRASPLSTMPEGLLDPFFEEDVIDLVAFLLAGGASDGAPYR
jgi:putative heme-binding domain-containing protein